MKYFRCLVGVHKYKWDNTIYFDELSLSPYHIVFETCVICGHSKQSTYKDEINHELRNAVFSNENSAGPDDLLPNLKKLKDRIK